MLWVRLRGAAEELWTPRPQPQCAHSSLDALATHAAALALQLSMDTWTTVAILAFGVHRSDLYIELCGVLGPSAGCSIRSRVHAAARYLEYSANRGNRRVGLVGQAVHVCGHDVPSLAKKVAARFRISSAATRRIPMAAA
jgi:hypothetical protein